MIRVSNKITCRLLVFLFLSFFGKNALAGSVDLGFSDVYRKGVMDTHYRYPIIIAGGVTFAGGLAAFSVMTAGTGAPAAVAGSSKVAAFIGGGGQGSYMAGLSTIGGWVGGNAITGAAILNGAMAGVAGGGGLIGTSTAAIAYATSGYQWYKSTETNDLFFETRIPYKSISIGSDRVIDSIERISELIFEINDIQESITSEELVKHEFKRLVKEGDIDQEEGELIIARLTEGKENLESRALFLLDQVNSVESNQRDHLVRLISNPVLDNYEDIIVLSMVAWNLGEYELFNRALDSINMDYLGRKGYYYYLRALSSLNSNDLENGLRYAALSANESSYALEPYFLMLMAMSEEYEKNLPMIELVSNHALQNHNANRYASRLNKANFYNRVSAIHFQAGDYSLAKDYASRSIGELGLLQRRGIGGNGRDLFRLFRMQLANSKYMLGEEEESKEIYKSIVGSASNEEASLLYGLYIGN